MIVSAETTRAILPVARVISTGSNTAQSDETSVLTAGARIGPPVAKTYAVRTGRSRDNGAIGDECFQVIAVNVRREPDDTREFAASDDTSFNASDSLAAYRARPTACNIARSSIQYLLQTPRVRRIAPATFRTGTDSPRLIARIGKFADAQRARAQNRAIAASVIASVASGAALIAISSHAESVHRARQVVPTGSSIVVPV